MFSLSNYRYSLPTDLIAQEAIHPRHNARMMVIDRETGKIKNEDIFWNIDMHLGDDRVIFFNDSRVVRSRVILSDTPYTRPDGTRGTLIDGEIFYLSTIGENEYQALVRPGNKFKIGTIFTICEYQIEVISITESGRVLRIEGGSISDFLATYGSLPLPPYIEYSQAKEADYQTSFARADGSVAAPTASLHFTSDLMNKISNPKEFLTLHVGLGTFKGIQTQDIRDYEIHRERVEISLDIFAKIAKIKIENKKVVAVGTTATRTLESLPYLWQSLDQDMQNQFDANTHNYWKNLTKVIQPQYWIYDILTNYDHFGGISFETSIYITPGYQFQIVDDLVTNFHLGESSLLVLVVAFLGYEKTMEIYKQAIKNRYRFYSFGDGMYIRSK
ncbi:S-adenosylmethionine:tRNA ribosyltransferase-isomerase [Candidatus Gracilibacteria bacterium]|nr:S-adenosylmethionine:tRNA ribosyltransferase-isomerase [Candidatus Gracilibacteria bacterium]